MRTINVIEVVNNNVIGLTSYGITEGQLIGNTIETVENHFAKCALENDAHPAEIDECIENGYYSNNNYSVCLVWSDIVEL